MITIPAVEEVVAMEGIASECLAFVITAKGNWISKSRPVPHFLHTINGLIDALSLVNASYPLNAPGVM